MSAYIISENKNVLRIGGVGDLSLFRTFDCGQCFRFDPVADSEYSTEYSGVALGKRVSFAQNKEGELFIIGAAAEEYPVWEKYLSLNEDYDSLNRSILDGMKKGQNRDITRRAMEAAKGIRILKQEPFEALCSFIISQNNNIPRIKKIISNMCEKYGEQTEDGAFAFPTAAALCEAGEEGLFALRTGFRAKYIYDAARLVVNDPDFLGRVSDCTEYAEAEELLCGIKGVGPKVAACTLLFGFGRYDAFPVDVWIKRVLERHFTRDFDHREFGKNAGLAQQYLFYYERYLGGNA